MRHVALWTVVCVGALAAGAPSAGAGGTADIAQETLRSLRAPGRVVSFWWLPPEYWAAAAREQGKSRAEIAVVEDLFRDYLLIAALDVAIKDGAIDSLSTVEIVRRLGIHVNGRPADVLREVDPRLQELAADLSYVLQTSLGALGAGLHILPLANLGDGGEPLVTGAKPCRVAITYRASAASEPFEIEWRGPLSAVAGARRCPEGGERLEASWTHCPWHGVPVDGG